MNCNVSTNLPASGGIGMSNQHQLNRQDNSILNEIAGILSSIKIIKIASSA